MTIQYPAVFLETDTCNSKGSFYRISESEKPKHHVFLLLDGFTHLTFACAIEPLRLANFASKKDVYSWSVISENGESVDCSNGTTFLVNSGLNSLTPRDSLIIVGGQSPRKPVTKSLLAYIRRERARGVAIAALGAGSYVVALAGILDFRACAVHWHEYDAFVENFPKVRASHSVFVAGKVPTSAGGTAAADLFLHLICTQNGPKLAAQVADLMVYGGIRGPHSVQKASVHSRFGIRNFNVISIINCMEKNIDTPVSILNLSEQVGLSVRQIERNFKRYLNESPMTFYMRLRLTKADTLLLQTSMTMVDIAFACGFKSQSHFSKLYKKQFGLTPSKQRIV